MLAHFSCHLSRQHITVGTVGRPYAVGYGLQRDREAWIICSQKSQEKKGIKPREAQNPSHQGSIPFPCPNFSSYAAQLYYLILVLRYLCFHLQTLPLQHINTHCWELNSAAWVSVFKHRALTKTYVGKGLHAIQGYSVLKRVSMKLHS